MFGNKKHFWWLTIEVWENGETKRFSMHSSSNYQNISKKDILIIQIEAKKNYGFSEGSSIHILNSLYCGYMTKEEFYGDDELCLETCHLY